MARIIMRRQQRSAFNASNPAAASSTSVMMTRSTNNNNFLFVRAIAVAVAIVSSSTNFFVNGQSCTACHRGAAFLTMAPQPVCNELRAKTSGLFETDTECMDLKLLTFQSGCCPNPPIGYCGYCEDPNIEYNPEAIIDTGQFVTPYNCFEYAAQNEAFLGMFEDGKCEDTFMRRGGHYCECGPEQVQQCWMCPDQNPPTKPEKTDAWVTNAKCRGIEYLYSLLTEEECSSFPFTVGVDLSIYCGCNGLNQTEIEEQQELYRCNFCQNGGYVTNPDTVYTTPGKDLYPKTCRQAEDFARDIVKTPAACDSYKYFGKAREVCECYDPNSSAPSPSSLLLLSPIRSLLFLFITSSLSIIVVSSLV